MNKIAQPLSQAACMTVGDLISEPCRWPDHAAVRIRCPLQHQELRFFRIESPTPGVVDIELDPAPEASPVVAT